MQVRSSPMLYNRLRAASLGLVLISALGLAACQEGGGTQGGPPAMPPSQVGIITVKTEAIPITNELPGRIAPTRIAEVRPRVSGIVVERVFTQGSFVKEGDVLYRIDPQPFRLQVESAKAALERAQAVQLRAQQQQRRSKELEARNVTSTQALETSVAELAQSTADVASARAALATAQLNLEYADVKAPISGRIGRARITEGALVSSTGAESLATIQQLDPVYADFTQSVNELIRLRRAMTTGHLTGADEAEAKVRLLFDDGSSYPQTGRLLFSEATVDATTGQVTMRGQFPNADNILLPGMYVRIMIEQGIEPEAVAIPQQAIQRDTGGQALVYVVNAQDTVEVRPIRAGRTIGNRWVIDDGLKNGDRVIVEGFQKIRPGAKVVPQDWKAATADASGAAQPAPASGQ